MSKINGYGVYQNFYKENMQRNANTKKDNTVKKTEETKRPNKAGLGHLSERAKQLLKELKQKYSNMDFIVADYESEEEAEQLMARGSKEFSVLIEPELLEEMATDEEVKEKHLAMLEDATSQLSDMQSTLKEEGNKEVKKLGVSIGRDGVLRFFADLEQINEKQRERIEEAKEEKKDKIKKTRVNAASVEELLEKIRKIDWEQIQEEEAKTTGSMFDATV